MIIVIDDFLNDWEFKLVKEEIKKLKYYNGADHPNHASSEKYPGIRTEEFIRVHPLLDSFIIKKLDTAGTIFTQRPYRAFNYGQLRIENDYKESRVHRDAAFDWAYTLYMSDTNLKSGTTMYESEDSDIEDDNVFVKFVQNRIVLFDVTVPHMVWHAYGKDIDDGRLSVNGFCSYNRQS